MVLAVVRSHYGDDPKHLHNREKIYRAGNALASWLGLHSVFSIALMQEPGRVEEFRRMILSAK